VLFSLAKKHPLDVQRTSIHPKKCAPTAKDFRPLRRATKGSAFGFRKLLKKLDQNFYFCGEQFPQTFEKV
jgi:hypothetical protein